MGFSVQFSIANLQPATIYEDKKVVQRTGRSHGLLQIGLYPVGHFKVVKAQYCASWRFRRDLDVPIEFWIDGVALLQLGRNDFDEAQIQHRACQPEFETACGSAPALKAEC